MHTPSHHTRANYSPDSFAESVKTVEKSTSFPAVEILNLPHSRERCRRKSGKEITRMAMLLLIISLSTFPLSHSIPFYTIIFVILPITHKHMDSQELRNIMLFQNY